jgi:hypothetical protein
MLSCDDRDQRGSAHKYRCSMDCRVKPGNDAQVKPDQDSARRQGLARPLCVEPANEKDIDDGEPYITKIEHRSFAKLHLGKCLPNLSSSTGRGSRERPNCQKANHVDSILSTLLLRPILLSRLSRTRRTNYWNSTHLQEKPASIATQCTLKGAMSFLQKPSFTLDGEFADIR